MNHYGSVSAGGGGGGGQSAAYQRPAYEWNGTASVPTWGGQPGQAFVTITPAVNGHVNIPFLVSGAPPVSNTFSYRTPKPDQITVVKLEKANLTEVAKVMVHKFGPEVSVITDGINYGNRTFRVGQFIVQDYNYDSCVITYRVATLDERIKYDLR